METIILGLGVIDERGVLLECDELSVLSPMVLCYPKTAYNLSSQMVNFLYSSKTTEEVEASRSHTTRKPINIGKIQLKRNESRNHFKQRLVKYIQNCKLMGLG